MSTAPALVIDAHLHVWDRERHHYPWLTPAAGALYRSFLPAEAAAVLHEHGVRDAVLVQAEDSVSETEWLLSLAQSCSWVRGVVGWVALDDPAAAAAQLDAYDNPALVGIRHLVHDDPRDEFFALPSVRESLARVAAHGLVFDVPDAWPRHLGALSALAASVPDLVIVVDHLGKPPWHSAPGDEAWQQWAAQVRHVAAFPQVVAKLSGLPRPGNALSVDAVRASVDVALEAFGPERLMFGSDWPVSATDASYEELLAVTTALIDGLSPSEREAIWMTTAQRVYFGGTNV